MARVGLTLLSEDGFRFANPIDRSGEPGLIPSYRLLVSVYFTPPEADDRHPPTDDWDERRTAELIVDTGGPLTILPSEVWQPMSAEIRWLEPPAGTSWPRLGLAGGRWEYRIGRCRLAAFDTDGHWPPPAWMPAMCLNDYPNPPPALLGLQSSLLLRRRFRNAGASADDLPEWWLEDNAWW